MGLQDNIPYYISSHDESDFRSNLQMYFKVDPACDLKIGIQKKKKTESVSGSSSTGLKLNGLLKSPAQKTVSVISPTKTSTDFRCHDFGNSYEEHFRTQKGFGIG